DDTFVIFGLRRGPADSLPGLGQTATAGHGHDRSREGHMAKDMRRTLIRLSLPLGFLLLGATACGGGGNDVGATLSNFKIALDKTSGKTGDVTFNIKNDGPSTHEFVVFRTDLAPDALPTTTADNGATIVDEEGAGVEAI